MVPLDKDFVAILISFLDGADNAGEVLNDFFEERDQPRAVPVGGDSNEDLSRVEYRLGFILNSLLPIKLSNLIACEFSKHAVKNSSLKRKVVKNANKVYAALAKFNGNEEATFKEQKALMALANKFLGESWSSDGSPDARAAWSVWATVMAKPSNAAASAQAVDDGELDWQVGYLREVLLRRVESS